MNDRANGPDAAPKAGSDPKYDGQRIFMPLVEALRPGDLILTRNRWGERARDRKISSGIAKATGGKFSHVMVCSIPPTLVEAMPEGVGTISLQRCFVHDLDNVQVLRHPDPAVAGGAAARLQFHIGRTYSVSRAVVSPLPVRSMGVLRDRGIFCSALAATVFRQAGGEDVFTQLPEKTTPSTIEHYAGLIDVTAEIFRPARAPKNVELMSSLDGERRPSPSERQTQLLQRYAAEVFPAADTLVERFPEAGLNPPMTFFEILNLIVDAFARSEQVRDKIRFQAAVRALDEQAAALLNVGEYAAIVSEMRELDQNTLQYALRASFSPRPDIGIEEVRGLLNTTRAQMSVRRGGHESFLKDAWPTGPSKAIASWLDINAPVLQAYERQAVVFGEILERLEPRAS